MLLFGMFVLFFWLFILFAFFSGASVLFRMAVKTVNRLIGASGKSAIERSYEENDEWIGYRYVKPSVAGIPEPSFGKGMLTFLVMMIIDLLAGLPVRIVFGASPFEFHRASDEAIYVCHIMGVVFSFPLVAWILSSILPTSFGRACLILLITYLIYIAAAVVIVIFIYVVVG